MSLKSYVKVWALITIVLAFENYALNASPGWSILGYLKTHTNLFPDLKITAQPGKEISLWAGWIGIGLMTLMNVYSVRKRWSPLKRLGNLASWLDFHIFCGLLGPTFIVFHCNFKVGGLVAVSFWSMVISFSSGIIGRYFYIQISAKKADLIRLLESTNTWLKSALPDPSLQSLKTEVSLMAGLKQYSEDTRFLILRSIFRAIIGDVRLHFGLNQLSHRVPQQTLMALRNQIIFQRRILYLDEFERVMGYWHSFHFPFAIFMYVVAALHILVATFMRVN